MKYFKNGFLALSILMLSGISQSLEATHIVGADMTFECKADEWFEINLTVRRDCINGDEEAVFDDPAYVGIFDAFGTPLNWLGSLGAVRMELVSIEDVMPNADECAYSGGPICVSEARYVGKAFLPFREKGYILSYQRCCRNETLSNITNPLETGNTSFVCITEESLTSCNSSPVFQEWPELFVCAGEPLSFNASAVDPDGDRLVYQLYTPHVGGSLATPQPIPPAGPPYDTVEYAPGFSLDNMLGSGTPLTIDANTGVLSAVPGAVGQYLVGVLVEEWRDGEILSKTRRNFEYNVRTCGVGGESLSFTNSEPSCGETAVTFNNTSTDQNLDFVWNFNFPSTDPAFMSTDVSPTFTFPGSGTYRVRLTAPSSDVCNAGGGFERTIVIEDGELLSYTTSTKACLGLSIPFTNTSPNQNQDFIWNFNFPNTDPAFMSTEVSPTFTFPGPGTYSVRLTNASGEVCNEGGGFVSTIFVSDAEEVNFTSTPDVQCEGSTVQFNNTSPNQNQDFVWNFNYPSSDPIYTSTEASPSYEFPGPGSYRVRLTNASGNVCNEGGGFERTVRIIDSRLEAAFTAALSECQDNGQKILTLTSQAVENTPSYELGSQRYDVSVGGNSTSYNGPDVSVSVPGGQTLTVTMVVGSNSTCSATARETIDNSVSCVELPTFVGMPATICPGESKRIVMNPNSDWTYTWAPDPTLTLEPPYDPIAMPEQTTTYFVTVSNDAGSVAGEVTVTVEGEFLDISITDNNPGCATTNANLTANVSNNPDNIPLVYDWSFDPNFGTVVATGQTVDIPLDGSSNVIYVRAGGAGFCGSNVPGLAVNQGIQTNVLINPTSINICDSDMGTVSVSSVDPDDSITVVWESSPNITSDTNSAVIDVVALEGETEFFITYTATNADGCTLTETIRVPVNIDGGPEPSPDTNVECGTTMVQFSIDPFYQDGDVLWDFGMINGEEVTSTLANPTIDFGEAGTYTAMLSSNGSGVCSFDPVPVSFQVPPILVIESDQELDNLICEGVDSSFTFGATTNGGTIAWSDQDNNFLGIGEMVTVSSADVTTVRGVVSDVHGCTDSIIFTISEYIFDISIDSDDAMCATGPVDVTATDNTGANLSYMWISEAGGIVSGGDTNVASVDPENAGDLRLIVTNDDLGCVMEYDFPVMGSSGIEASISASQTNIVSGESTTLTVTTDAEGATYMWSDGSTEGPTRTVSPTETTTYTVTITDTNGCTAEASITITVDPAICSNVFLPTAFTPNGDGSNDEFRLRSDADVDAIDLQILDRWGKEVFRTTSQNEGWNGFHRQTGNELSPDVYAYCLKVTCNGQETITAGNVTLIR